MFSEFQSKIDYTRLGYLLATADWKEADEETYKMMLQIAGRATNNCFTLESIYNFPGEHLRTVDRLWKHYSNGHFGLSVQKRIYQSVANTRKSDKLIWRNFLHRVGWRREKDWDSKLFDLFADPFASNQDNYQSVQYPQEINFSLHAPEGHLPARLFNRHVNMEEKLKFLIDSECHDSLFFKPLLLREELQ